MGNFKDFEPLKANGRASRDWFWKQKWDQKWNPSVLRHFEQKCKWHHMTKSTFTCFLGHGTPIFQTNTCRFAIWTIPWHYKHWIRQFQEYLPWLHQVLPLVCWNAVPKWCMHKLTDCNFGLKLFLNESSMELESIRGLENFVPKIPAEPICKRRRKLDSFQHLHLSLWVIDSRALETQTAVLKRRRIVLKVCLWKRTRIKSVSINLVTGFIAIYQIKKYLIQNLFWNTQNRITEDESLHMIHRFYVLWSYPVPTQFDTVLHIAL